MADQNSYQAAMREAANAAWDRDWERAIQAYREAVALVADDSQALAGLALSYLEAGHLDDALGAYKRVSELVPNDPLPHEKMAEIFEIMNRTSEAARKHVMVGEIYFNRKDFDRAAPHWQEAVLLDPDLPQPHMRLAMLYEKNIETSQAAVYEFLELARLLQSYNQASKAEQALQRASRLDPLNSEVRNAVDDLRRGHPIQRPQPNNTALAPQTHRAGMLPRSSDGTEEEEDEPQRTPADEAARQAMGQLADLIWSGEVPSSAQGPLLRAIDLHQIGDVENAIAAYTQAFEAGLNHPGLRLNLGLLYQHTHRTRDAINLLSQAASDPDFAIAARLAMGLAYFAEDDVHRAAQYLIQALRDADQLLNDHFDVGGYDRLAAGLSQQGHEQLTEVCRALALVLNDPNWRSKLGHAFSGYAAQGKGNYVPDLIELLIEGGRPEIAEVMERVNMFMVRNMLRLAMEEAHYALERSPDYLPAHRIIADIMVKEGRTQDAAHKINLVASTYMLRGNPDKAADLFAEVIQLWPADIGARERVLDMLKSQKRVNDVLQHYQEMGDLFYRLRADPDRAIVIYNEALAYGEENQADPALRIAILKSLADIEAQRLNWRESLVYYDKIVALAPDDQEAALSLIDLNFQTGQSERAIKALDGYMRYCVTNGYTDRVVTTLEEQVRRHPDETALRQRLADVYRQQRRIAEAVAQMDALGELFLDAGRKTDAIDTIRRIIALNPPDLEGYQQLLEQLESSQ